MFDKSHALRIQNVVKEVKLFFVRDPLIAYKAKWIPVWPDILNHTVRIL